MSSRQPFCFLDLPTELRCMVYEAIETTIRKEELDISEWSVNDEPLSVIMFRRALQMSILTTCRLVNQEASPIMARKIQAMSNEPMRFSMNWDAAAASYNLWDFVFDTSPGAAFRFTTQESSGPVRKSIVSCRSYYMAISDISTRHISVPTVEFTFTGEENSLAPYDAVRMPVFLYKIWGRSKVAFNAFFVKTPYRSAHLMSVQHFEDELGVKFKYLTDVEWADHTRKLEEIEKAAHNARG